MYKTYSIIIISIIMIVASPLFIYGQETQTTPFYTYRIVHTYPHDPDAFTQGLIYHDGVLYESTGLWGRSSLRKVALETGKVLQTSQLDDKYFGEGITLWQDQLVQLTWKTNRGFVYNLQTFEKLKDFTYATEGWGITHDEDKLIMSDGSDTLYFLNPQTFERIGVLPVRDQNNKPVANLNELEYINGEIFANIWYTNKLARISPKTGQVLGWIDLTGLNPVSFSGDNSQAVLNGIAYDEKGKRLFVTGKLWPKLFEIELMPCQQGRGDRCYHFKR
jgi:glutamine cyclotransferase